MTAGKKLARAVLCGVLGCMCALNASARPMIAWSSDRANPLLEDHHAGSYDIYVMDDLGNGVRRLTDDDGSEEMPAWSPDGERIAFSHHDLGDDGSSIFTMNADGGEWEPLTEHPRGGNMPKWSPNGKRIAFASGRGGNAEVYVINVDGSGMRNLTRHGAHDSYPAWSPDGESIAFSSDRRNDRYAVYVMDADGDNVRPVAGERWGGLSPTWSPDGQEIAYWSAHEATVIQPLLGGPERTLLDLTKHEMHPAWSLDGQKMAFELADANSMNIWVADIDGQNAVFNRNPDWVDASAPRMKDLAVDALGKLLAPWGRVKSH